MSFGFQVILVIFFLLFQLINVFFFNTDSNLPLSTWRHQDGTPTPAAYTTTASRKSNHIGASPARYIFSPHVLFFLFTLL